MFAVRKNVCTLYSFFVFFVSYGVRFCFIFASTACDLFAYTSIIMSYISLHDWRILYFPTMAYYIVWIVLKYM